ncbi:MAG: GatB/YqeY domain-containing protein, partial [Alphaproteobacteria bacterium]|nr:GatB/YqeY domain-containing protein [Alphaproteobacteria bacterium]
APFPQPQYQHNPAKSCMLPDIQQNPKGQTMLKDQLASALATAMREKDTTALAALRLALAAVRDLEASARTKDKQVTPQENILLLRKMVEQRRESAQTYRDAKREDLALREDQEIKVLQRFLPRELDDDTLNTVIEEIIREVNAETLKDIGRVMAGLREQYAGQVDMKKASELTRAKLGN